MAIDADTAEPDAPTGLIEIADGALAKVLEIRDGEDDPTTLGLRIEVTGASGVDYTYDLSFEPVAEAAEDDHVLTIGGQLTVMIPEASAENMQGATLDLPSNPMQGGLVIRNPNRPNPLEGIDLELTGTIEERLQQLLDQQINPSLASHGGFAALDRVEEPIAYVTMGGGCQGCAMSAATLREGITVMIIEAIDEITEVVDITDHAAGESPYFD